VQVKFLTRVESGLQVEFCYPAVEKCNICFFVLGYLQAYVNWSSSEKWWGNLKALSRLTNF